MYTIYLLWILSDDRHSLAKSCRHFYHRVRRALRTYPELHLERGRELEAFDQVRVSADAVLSQGAYAILDEHDHGHIPRVVRVEHIEEVEVDIDHYDIPEAPPNALRRDSPPPPYRPRRYA
ncbi:hypothetical protein LTS15_005913 [Exophiala xenobiotica]|nr:hypothetical protein LTS15_005913 [Exophiala xenobiotica]